LTPDAFALVKQTAAEADHGAPSSPEAWAAVFDRLAGRSPAASVALYSLGDETRLQVATDEIIGWLRREGLLGPDRLLVEIGCGIGRFLRALSPEVEAVVGLDVSGVMCAEARDRTRGLNNVVVLQTAGRDLSMIDDGGADLVLAVDSFPYLVSAGLAEAHVREAARALAPGGELVVFNWSYVGDLTQHKAAFEAASALAGLQPRYVGQQTLSTWDGLVFTACAV
jgi:SAM-dependent methyltransferase